MHRFLEHFRMKQTTNLGRSRERDPTGSAGRPLLVHRKKKGTEGSFDFALHTVRDRRTHSLMFNRSAVDILHARRRGFWGPSSRDACHIMLLPPPFISHSASELPLCMIRIYLIKSDRPEMVVKRHLTFRLSAARRHGCIVSDGGLFSN